MKNKIKIAISLLLAVSFLLFPGCNGNGNNNRDRDDETKSSATSKPAPSVTETEAASDEADITEKTPLHFAKDPLTLEISAPQSFVFNLNTNEFLYLTCEGEVLYPASTTKLLTIVYALTLVEPDEVATVGDELSLLGEHPSLAFISRGNRLTVEMLIEGMMLPSGNDAAYTLAAFAGRRLSDDPDNISAADAVALFMEGMNRYAAMIGVTGSNFTSPDGYFDEEHYSTVEDMALISAIAAKNEIIAKYARVQTDKVTYESGEWIEWTNTNKLIDPWSGYYSPYATGLKTGSLGDGNYCLVVTADIEGVQYVFGVFSEEQANARFADALIIIEALEDRIP